MLGNHAHTTRRGLIAAAALGAPLLAACGPAAAGPRQEKVPANLRLTTWTNIVNIPVWEQAVTRFNTAHAAEKLSVTMEHVPTDYFTKLTAEYAAGSAPDVIYASPADLQGVALKGMVKDLSPQIKADKINLADLNPPAQTPYMWDNKVWALACWNDTRILMINRTAFKAVGVPLPPEEWNGAGWTVDDFVSAAKKLTTPANNKWGFVNEGLSIKRWAWLFGAYYWNDDKVPTRSAFNSADNVNGLQFIRDLQAAHQVTPAASVSGPLGGWEKMFINGQAAMVWSGYKNVAATFVPVTEFEWATAPFPRAKSRVTNVSPQAFSTVSSTKHPEPSWTLIQDFSLGEGNVIMAGVSSMPAYKKLDVYKVSQVTPERRWMIKMLQDAMNTGKPEVPHPNVKPEMLRAMDEEVRDLLDEKKSAQEAARSGAERVNALFDQYGIQK